MPSQIIIIGAGPAGEAAATAIRRLDKTAVVTVIEKEQAGGLCLNKGCIPSKTLLEQVHKLSSAGKSIKWSELQTVKTDVVQGIRSQLEARLKREGIALVQGTATFKSPTSIEVQSSTKTETLNFDKAIITAGTDIYYPTALAAVKDQILNSDTMLQISETPHSIVIVGGGAIGCEFACLLNAAGSHVTIIEMKEGLLPGEDPAVATALAQAFEKRGIQIKTGNTVKDLKKTAQGWDVTLSSGETLSVEKVLSCVGRTPATQMLGLDKAGIKTEKNQIVVDEHLLTSNKNVYAAGDVAGSRLAHHASAQGEVAAANALGGSKNCDERFVPRCLYTWPEVASVGAWKYQLEEQGKPVKASRAFFKGSSKALAAGDTDGFVQLISEPESGKLLGAQIIGPHAPELIHVISVALKANMTLKDLADVMFAHPTLGESIREAARK
jgi:dihydrolipoamide dehydrogenase